MKIRCFQNTVTLLNELKRSSVARGRSPEFQRKHRSMTQPKAAQGQAAAPMGFDV